MTVVVVLLVTVVVKAEAIVLVNGIIATLLAVEVAVTVEVP